MFQHYKWYAVLVLALSWTSCGTSEPASFQDSASAPTKLYMDVHKLGPGKVKLEDVEKAHQKDLRVQGKYGVRYEKYWVDETSGTIYCLVHAPNPAAASAVHREAHGLVADEIVEMHSGILPAEAKHDGRKLFLCTHLAGPGAITGADVAQAHKKDLAAQGKHGVNFLRYWYDEASGRIHCLAEAPSREAVIATHKEAHGLVPQVLQEVKRGK